MYGRLVQKKAIENKCLFFCETFHSKYVKKMIHSFVKNRFSSLIYLHNVHLSLCFYDVESKLTNWFYFLSQPRQGSKLYITTYVRVGRILIFIEAIFHTRSNTLIITKTFLVKNSIQH